MDLEINSSNPAVRAIIEGRAPKPAIVAAARGALPIGQNDLLEILVFLSRNPEAELAQTAHETLMSQSPETLQQVFESTEVAPRVLDFYANVENLRPEAYEAILVNHRTPDGAITKFARATKSGDLLELISVNQQLLIRAPGIIDAIIGNPYRTAEAERRAAETKREFFEKERGVHQIASELRAQGKEAAAEFIEGAEFAKSGDPDDKAFQDALLLAEHIEAFDSEIDDSWLSLDLIEELYEETHEEREAIVNKILGELRAEEDSVSGERISMINRVMRMGMKDRMRLAMKGDREARNILIRDPNRIVAQAVIQNPKLTEQEVEKIATMRTVPEEVLRLIAINRKWARNYQIMMKLAQNPRTPLSNSITILTRLQTKDLLAMAKNRNISDAIRKQSQRLASARIGR
ncbi:MAG: hypothetical protein IPN69_06100 [Acidobacteria bacterium]|nr:hypothetical protein [Acidobacteriota bacterium]MBK8810292.1 hypothetical protein [Acidobacteriota bacterium]